jgi:sporulation protein YabP
MHIIQWLNSLFIKYGYRCVWQGGVKMIEEKKVPKPKVQNLILENREKLNITGVIDVESFNDECVVVDTELGMLVIRGIDLHINKLNIDNSELGIEGEIVSCEYSEREGSRSKGGGFFARMFK